MLKRLWFLFSLMCCASTYAAQEVVVSVRPVGMLVAAIGGERVQVAVLVPENAVPHDYRLKPSDLVKINNCWLLVWGGAQHESFLAGATSRLAAQQQLDVGSNRVGYHFWMDPAAASAEAKRISQSLSSLDPAGAPYYQANLQRLQAELEQADQGLAVRLTPFSGLAFIGTHDGVMPFARHYGIRQSGMLQADSAHSGGAGLATLQALRMQLQKGDAHCVMQDLEAASDIGTKLRIPAERIVNLDIMGNHLALDLEGYLQLLEGVARGVERCFAAAGEQPTH